MFRLSQFSVVSFVAGVVFGVGLLLVVQWVMPGWEVEKLHYQNGQLTIQNLVRYNAYTGVVERLATSEPE